MFVSKAPSSTATEFEPKAGRPSGRSKTIVLAALCALPLLLVFGILWREATALPLLDDYHAVFSFALDQHHLSTAGRLLGIVTAQHNEYKLIFGHAIMAADLGLTGHIHLLLLVWFGNLLLLLLGFVYWMQFRPGDAIERRLIWFLPLCWLLFQLTYAELIDWAMEGLQALAVVCFSVAALYLLTRASRRSFVLACIAGALAALSSANGFLVAAIGVPMILQQRRPARLLPWSITFGAALGAYLYRYSPVPHEAPASLLTRLVFIPSLLGGEIENMHGFPVHHAAIVLGLAMLVVYAHALRTGYYKRQPFIVATATFAIITAAMTGWVRSSLGLNLSLSSRYKIYSTLLIVFCYQYLADRLLTSQALSMAKRRAIYGATLAVAVIFALASDAVGLKLLRTRRAEAIASLGWYLSAPQTHSPFPDHLGAPNAANDATAVAVQAREAMTKVLAARIYRLPRKEVAEACANSACAAPAGR